MIKRITILMLLVQLGFISRCLIVKKDIINKLDLFYELIREKGIDYIVQKEIVLVFDYESITGFQKDIFENYQVNTQVYNDQEFELEILWDGALKVVKVSEIYRIEKGDLYD